MKRWACMSARDAQPASIMQDALHRASVRDTITGKSTLDETTTKFYIFLTEPNIFEWTFTNIAHHFGAEAAGHDVAGCRDE